MKIFFCLLNINYKCAFHLAAFSGTDCLHRVHWTIREIRISVNIPWTFSGPSSCKNDQLWVKATSLRSKCLLKKQPFLDTGVTCAWRLVFELLYFIYVRLVNLYYYISVNFYCLKSGHIFLFLNFFCDKGFSMWTSYCSRRF